MSLKTQRMVGWVLTALVGVFLLAVSSVGKFIEFPNKKEVMDKMGISLDLLPAIGILEIVVTVLFLIPRTSFLGAILVTGYLGGAVMTHLRVGEAWFFPIIIGVVMWVALGLRYPTIFRLALGKHESDRPAV